jgi:hypothetical protein
VSTAYGTPLKISGKISAPLERIALGSSGSSGAFDEAWLQRLVDRHPECLPISEIEPGFTRPVSVCMELPTRHGPIDNFLVTPDGDLVIVETKLWRNPEARRKVIAQALDYASCLFEMDYAELERAALAGDSGDRERPKSLFDAVVSGEEIDESAFIDAVNANLSRGRILILVVGDGIRSETQRIVGSLQSHAGFHFTFGLVELAVFESPGTDDLIVQPRTLARTVMVERGIVVIDDKRVAVQAGALLDENSVPRSQARKTITAERFLECMDEIQTGLAAKIAALLADLQSLDVYPEYKGSLNLKWDPPEGNSVNMGYITKGGQLWTEPSNWTVGRELARTYNEELAAALGLVLGQTNGDWWVQSDGHGPRLEEIADKLSLWPPVVARFQAQIRSKQRATESQLTDEPGSDGVSSAPEKT